MTDRRTELDALGGRLRWLLRTGSMYLEGAPLTIVAFGDSVTEGHTRVGTLEPDIIYHARVAEALGARYPGVDVRVVNAGVAGDTVTTGLGRLERDVLRHGPDLVLVGFGLNDAAGLGGLAGGLKGVPEFGRGLAVVVDRIREEAGADVVMLTPNFMATGDNPNIAVEERRYLAPLRSLQRQGVVAAFAAAVRQVASDWGVSVADVYAAWERLAASGRDTDELLANGLNHPGAEGHAIAAELVMAAIDELL